MSKNDRKDDGFYSKAIIAAIVVIWVSLVGGNWLGHYIVEKNLLGKSAKQEYNATVLAQKPKPWITVDPAQQQALERMQNAQPEETAAPLVVDSSTPAAEEPAETVSPAAEPPVVEAPPEATPASPAVAADPNAPAPTPTSAAGDAIYHLQFGSFASEDNAKAHVEDLAALGVDARVEEIDPGTGKKVYQVRGGDTTEEQARQQRDKLREQNVDSYLQSSH